MHKAKNEVGLVIMYIKTREIDFGIELAVIKLIHFWNQTEMQIKM